MMSYLSPPIAKKYGIAGSARITMDVCAKVVTRAKRMAEDKVVAVLRDKNKKTE